jgi:AcrR family transcriptional regulator
MSTVEARLSAAEACCALYIERGSTDIPIREIASAIGISERTFYRYFPIKAATVAPIFDWTTATFNSTIHEAPDDLPVRDVLRRGFRAMLGGPVEERTRRLFPLVFADHEMWSLFLRKVHDGERSLTPVLAPRLGVEEASAEGRAGAAAVASATRIALESMVTSGSDPEVIFMSILDAFAEAPLAELRGERVT